MPAGHYITVLSNYDKDIFHTNTNNNFKNRVANGIYCPPNSQIALIELSYMHNFRMKAKKNCSFTIFDFLAEDGKEWGKYTHVTIEEESINNSLDLVIMMNEYIFKHVPRMKQNQRQIFSLGENKHIWINFQSDDYLMIILKESLLPLLGALDKVVPRSAMIIGHSKKKESYTYKGVERKFSPKCNKREYDSQCTKTDYFVHLPHIEIIRDFMVLSNLSSPTHVASSMTSLLRVITVPCGTEGNRVVASFGQAPVYVPLSVGTITDIHIRLDTWDGEPVPLVGPVRALLHVLPPSNK